MRIRLSLLPALAIVLPTTVAAAPVYLDDRSTPEAVVRSLYNAINRKEYARAWSYFATPPAKSFEAYVKGYATTDAVEVKTGAASEEGAAGSIFYKVPVAIRAKSGESAKVFVGCYTLKLVNAQIGEPPFKPMAIEKGEIKPSDKDLAEALPKACPGEEPADADGAKRAQRLFAVDFSGECESLMDDAATPPDPTPKVYELRFRYTYEKSDAPEHVNHLYEFYCTSGAYNIMQVYYVRDEYDSIKLVTFAEPDLDIQYTDETNEKLKSLKIVGMRSASQLVNSEYDPASQSISSFSKWRGLGDASSSGSWVFREGAFVLQSYDVDATYDGEESPEKILDYKTQ